MTMLDRRVFSLAAIAACGGALGASGSAAAQLPSPGGDLAPHDIEGLGPGRGRGPEWGVRISVPAEAVMVTGDGWKLPHVEGVGLVGDARSLSVLKSGTGAPVISQDINNINYNDGRISNILFDLSSPGVGSGIEFMDTGARMSDWDFSRLHMQGPKGNPNSGTYGFRFGSNLTRARIGDCRIEFMDNGAEFSSRGGGQVIFDRLGIFSCHSGLVLANAGNNFIRVLEGDSVLSDFLVLQSPYNVVESVSCEQNGYATGPLLVIDGCNFNVIRRAIFAEPKIDGDTVAIVKNGASGNYLEIFLRNGKLLLEGAVDSGSPTSWNEIVAYIVDGDQNSDVVDNGLNNKITKRYTHKYGGPVVREWRNWQ